LNADLVDANAASVGPAGANAYARLYHSVVLLLPDATVWLAGGNPQRGTYEQNMEIYQPPYLFTSGNGGTALATRPTISSAPANISYGKSVYTAATGRSEHSSRRAAAHGRGSARIRYGSARSRL